MMTDENSIGATKVPIQMLLVEDSQHDADFIAMMLKRSPDILVDVDHATSLGEAIAAFSRCHYDIVLLDLGLPDSSGTESVSQLRDCSPGTPIVVLTGDDRNCTATAAIDSGAQDFLPKQHIVGQLLTRTLKHSIARNDRLVQAQSEAFVDGLTGHANRRACDAELERCISDFKRYKHPFCVALFDIDHFKRVNDHWGHETGDQVIKAVADALAENSRDSDQLARYGGEEFAITFPMTRLLGAEKAVWKYHRAVSQLVVGQHRLQVTVSAGFSEFNEQDDGRSLLARADEALYAAKLAGRNRCMPNCGQETTAGSQQSAGTSVGK